MSANASSTASSSVAPSRPADRPRRCGSTTVVCSTGTRVSFPSRSITGRNVAGRALVDVGATIVVLRCRKLIGLQDDRVTRCPLLSSARGSRRWEAKDLPPNHAYALRRGASWAMCSLMSRISSRPASSAARRSISSRSADRARRHAAASRTAVRTASESLMPDARATSRAATDASSKRRTWIERAICDTVARGVLHLGLLWRAAGLPGAFSQVRSSH
jgi:hypothetical protein